MGFFSKCCAKTNLPVVNQYKDYPEFSEVVALAPDGRIIKGSYDGYGNVAGEDLRETPEGKWIWDDVKFVLTPHYNGETYNEVPKSHDELAQGHFMADEFLEYCKEVGSFKNRAAYVRAFKKYANW